MPLSFLHQNVFFFVVLRKQSRVPGPFVSLFRLQTRLQVLKNRYAGARKSTASGKSFHLIFSLQRTVDALMQSIACKTIQLHSIRALQVTRSWVLFWPFGIGMPKESNFCGILGHSNLKWSYFRPSISNGVILLMNGKLFCFPLDWITYSYCAWNMFKFIELRYHLHYSSQCVISCTGLKLMV